MTVASGTLPGPAPRTPSPPSLLHPRMPSAAHPHCWGKQVLPGPFPSGPSLPAILMVVKAPTVPPALHLGQALPFKGHHKIPKAHETFRNHNI